MLPTRKSPINSEVNNSLRFRKIEHLKGRNEIREVFGKGKRIGCQGAKLLMLKNSLPHNRICFSLPRGFGTAVERNHAKRLGREAYRIIRPRLRCGYDLIVIAYSENTSVNVRTTFAGRMEQLMCLFSRAGLLL